MPNWTALEALVRGQHPEDFVRIGPGAHLLEDERLVGSGAVHAGLGGGHPDTGDDDRLDALQPAPRAETFGRDAGGRGDDHQTAVGVDRDDRPGRGGGDRRQHQRDECRQKVEGADGTEHEGLRGRVERHAEAQADPAVSRAHPAAGKPTLPIPVIVGRPEGSTGSTRSPSRRP